MKNRIIVIGGSSNPTEQKVIEKMVESILKKEPIVFDGPGRSSKAFISQYVNKVIEAVNHIPTNIALVVQDEEGYVNISGIGKIHIQNWLDKEIQNQNNRKEAIENDHNTIMRRWAFTAAFPNESFNPSFIEWLKKLKEDHSAPVQTETAFQRRFYAAGYDDPSGKVVRETMIYDRVTEESYTKEQFDALYFKVEKIFNDNNGSSSTTIDDISDDLLDTMINVVKKADFVQGKEGQTSKKKDRRIKLNNCEIQSGSSRVHWAERLITQLPEGHDGRNSWLLNYGIEEEAVQLRNERQILFDSSTNSAMPTSK